MQPALIFVCTGNTCRSPMAQVRCTQLAAEADHDLSVGSAGISAIDGRPASAEAQAVAREAGADLGAHSSRALDPDVAKGARLLITMTAAHRDVVLDRWPKLAARVMTLGEVAGTAEDVADPWGGSLEEYRKTWEQISRLLTQAWPTIVRRVGEDRARI